MKEKSKKKWGSRWRLALTVLGIVAILIGNSAAVGVTDIGKWKLAGTDLSVGDFFVLNYGTTSVEQGIEKGEIGPLTMEKAYAVFTLSGTEKVNRAADASATTRDGLGIPNAVSSNGWVTVLSQDFEPSSPPVNITFFTGADPCYYGWTIIEGYDDYVYEGSCSIWCAGISYDGCPDLDPANDNYANNMRTGMKFGPFDLSDATQANVTFYTKYDTEYDYDGCGLIAQHDEEGWEDEDILEIVTGTSSGWIKKTLDLQSYCGDSTVWFTFVFISDVSNTGKGVFVDNVVISKYVDGGNPSIELTPTSHNFSTVQQGQCSSEYTFTLTNTGAGTATGSVSLTGTHANQFTITSGGGSFSLGADQSKTIKAKFCPTSTGSKTANLYANGTNCNDDSSSLSGTCDNLELPVVTVEDGNINAVSATTVIDITLDTAPDGLSGYNLTISLANPDIAEIVAVEFPTWATIYAQGTLPADAVWLKAVDMMEQVDPGATNVLLAQLTIRGDTEGACTINAVVTQMDDDEGGPITPSVDPGQLTVGGLPPIPGYDNPPTDPDGDGLYEDLNGNGGLDFDDVVQLFKYLEWIEANEPIACFDFNGNGRLDFDDIVQLFKEV